MTILLFTLLSSSVISFLYSTQLLTRGSDEKPLFPVSMILHPPLVWLRVGSGPATTENARVRSPRGSNTNVDWTSVLSSQRIAHSLRADKCHRLLRSTPWARPMVIWNATFWMCGTGCFCILAPHESSCALVHAAVLDGPT